MKNKTNWSVDMELEYLTKLIDYIFNIMIWASNLCPKTQNIVCLSHLVNYSTHFFAVKKLLANDCQNQFSQVDVTILFFTLHYPTTTIDVSFIFPHGSNPSFKEPQIRIDCKLPGLNIIPIPPKVLDRVERPNRYNGVFVIMFTHANTSTPIKPKSPLMFQRDWISWNFGSFALCRRVRLNWFGDRSSSLFPARSSHPLITLGNTRGSRTAMCLSPTSRMAKPGTGSIEPSCRKRGLNCWRSPLWDLQPWLWEIAW
mmetsp:Transcript_21648/g.29740  ORF Transcript_21648/g.29740 Transcript_21648/m.29740 type:complete len:256 (+) Transcript_21648:549-1316(+)